MGRNITAMLAVGVVVGLSLLAAGSCKSAGEFRESALTPPPVAPVLGQCRIDDSDQDTADEMMPPITKLPRVACGEGGQSALTSMMPPVTVPGKQTTSTTSSTEGRCLVAANCP